MYSGSAQGVVERVINVLYYYYYDDDDGNDDDNNNNNNNLSHLIYPLTARVIGAPQMISQQVSSIFTCFALSSRTWRTPGLSIPCVVFPLLLLSALSSSHFHCAFQDGFGQT